MAGERAVPALDAAALVAAVPALAAVERLETESPRNLPAAPVTAADALEIARPAAVAAFVPVVRTWQGGDGALLRAAVAAGADGLVLVALGAGHVGALVFAELRAAAGEMPVVVTTRPERGAVLRATYGFEGSEA